MNLLPTPPRTTHKDKENRPPTPVTPANSNQRVLHIAWSQENLHHAYSTEIRPLPSSSSIKAPNKTILKKAKIPLMDQSSPDQPSRYITPEPSDPLQLCNYLKSPLSTLLASQNLSDHGTITLIDLTEAYSELLRRLKSRGPALLDLYGPIPALSPLQESSEQLARIFRRDIERSLVDPQSSFNPSELATSESQPWSSPLSISSTTKKRGFTEQEIKHARDLCNLCHTALRCFSTFAVIPALYSVFSDEQLADILTGILAIPLCPSLPTPNARKTCQLAIWVLQVQRLPSAVLAPAADRITYAIRRGIDGELGREGKNGAASDGFKAIVMLAGHKPEIFIPSFAELLPSILATLTSSNLALRVEAANALLGLASSLSMYSNPPPALLASFSLAVGTYLSEQHQARTPGQELSPIGKIFRTCLNAEAPAHASHSPMWALSCIAAFIVLSRGDALSQPRTVKFILTHLQTAMAAKRTTVRATAGLVWRALIWSCIHLDKQGETEEKKTSAWKVVRQLIDGAIGISVVAALVGHQDIKSKRLVQAIEVISAMIKKGGKTCEEAVDVLQRLLHGVGQMQPIEHGWDENSLLARPIFDGTLLRADWKALSGHVKHGLQKSAVIQDIVPLTEQEVAEHWDDLFKLWKEAITKAPLEENGDVPLPLLNSWMALLTVQAQTYHGFDDVPIVPMLSEELTQLLMTYLIDVSLDWSLGPTAPAWSPQVLKLGFVRKLWLCVREVFPVSTVHTAASKLLNEIITGEFSLRQSAVLEAWSQLFIELVLSMSAEQLRFVWHGQICDRQDIILQDLWHALSTSWLSNGVHYSSTLEIICAPLDFPSEINFTRNDLDIWSNLIKHAIVSASVYKVEPRIILEFIASRISFSQHAMAICAVLPSLLSLLSATPPEDTSILPQSLLRLTNDVMNSAYPPSDGNIKNIIFSMLRSLSRIVGDIPAIQTVQALCLIQEGAVAWIGDKSEELSENEFNEEVIPFYGECLKSLTKVPPSAEVLSELSPLLVSAFNRIPKPALGPSLFKAYWSETYQKYPTAISHPEPLKLVLRSIQEVMCEPEEVLAPGISQATETQSQEWMIGSDIVLRSNNEAGDRQESSSDQRSTILAVDVSGSHSPAVADNQLKENSNNTTPLIKKESPELHLPHALTPAHSTHRKRRKSFSVSSKKKRKAEFTVKPNVEIINVSDDDDGESIIEDSIVIVRAPLASKRAHQLHTGNDAYPNKDCPSEIRPKRRKLGNEPAVLQTTSRVNQTSRIFPHSSPKDDNSQESDSSLPNSRPDGFSSRFITSPRVRYSRSEPLDHPSDDVFMSSSPLKSVMARRQLRRSNTAPVNAHLNKESSEDNLSMLNRLSRSGSEGFMALEQAHDAITKGNLEMGVEDLLKASKMLNGISVALNEQISKKLASSEAIDN